MARSTRHPGRGAARPALLLALAALPALPALSSGAEFIRSDSTADGSVDIGDPVATLQHLFAAGPPLACADAADSNDTGALDIADPIHALGHLFRGGPPPAEPYPLPGLDPTPDGLDCGGEPDVDLHSPMQPMPGDAADLAAIEAGPHGGAESSAAGLPLEVDLRTFEALGALGRGASVRAAMGADAERFLAAFFAGHPPPADGPSVYTRDAAAFLGADGCLRVDPALIDSGSYDRPPAASFLRGDVDSSGRTDAEDARLLLGCLLEGEGCPRGCWDAADANDDGVVSPADFDEILLAAIGEIRLPSPGEGCGADPTPDELPACTPWWCAPDPRGLRLEVEPETICGAGPHLVELIATDIDGNQARAGALVTLCEAGRGDCPPVGPAPGPTPARRDPHSPPVCRWVTALHLDPEGHEQDFRQISYGPDGAQRGILMGPPIASSGPMEIWRTDLGPGPEHALVGLRLNAQCSTPATELSMTKSGRVQFRANVICLESDGTLLSCEGEAEVEGVYRSKVEVGTEAGSSCGRDPNRVEALSQDEASLKASERELFAKGSSVHNGNQISSEDSFTAGAEFKLVGPGLAANPKVQSGYSQTILHQTGRAEDTVDAFGNVTVNLPLTVDLWAKGRIEIHAHHRSWARAKTSMGVAAFWLVAKARCPVPGPLYGELFLGSDGAAREKAKHMARQFRLTRLGY